MKKQRVLIVCTGNSARSQIAEGLIRHEAGDRFEVFSAGTKPTTVRPEAVAVLSDLGIDISQQWSKSVDEFEGQQFDYVVTVCGNARESCRVFPGAGKRIHRSFKDPVAVPAEQQLRLLRELRDEISGWLREFVRDAPV